MGLRKDKYQTVYTWLMMRLPNDMRPPLRQEWMHANRNKSFIRNKFAVRMTMFSNPTRSSILMYVFDNAFDSTVHGRTHWMAHVTRLQKFEAVERNRATIKGLKATNKRLVHDLLGQRVLDEP